MVVESPTENAAQLEIDRTFQAARVTARPHDFRAADGSHIGGHYRTILTTGATTGIAAGGALLSLRWTNPDRALEINRIRAWATIGTVFTTAQENSIDIARVTGFTAADTGGTAIDLVESCRKNRSNMKASAIQSLRVAGAAALTPGTGAEESPCGGLVMAGLLNVVGSMAGGDLFKVEPGLEHPLVINNLEGLRIRIRTAQGAAGVVVWTFEIDWMEVPTLLLGA